MTFRIKDIEKKLGFNLKPNTFAIGVDTASTCGIAILETNNSILNVEAFTFKLPAVNKEDELSEKIVEKLTFMLKNIRDFKAKVFAKKHAKNTVLIIENSFLSINVVTFGVLRMMGGIVFSELYDNFEDISIIFPLSARKIVGFKSQLQKGVKREEKKKEIINWINNIFSMKETDDNICDAIILALCGLKKEVKNG